jgi:hypothetical protein
MKKRNLYPYLFLSYFLVSCMSTKASTREKLGYDEHFQDICELGKLDCHDKDTKSYGKNLLPNGYYGSFKDTGIFEFGGKAGDENGKSCPIIDFNITNTSTAILFSVTFEKNPLDFPSNHIRKKLGYEIIYYDVNSEEQSINHYVQATRFSELFTPSPISGYHFDDSYSKVTFFIYEPMNAICMSFNFLKGEKLKSIRFIYGDLPMTYQVVGARISKNNLNKELGEGYSGINDCTRNDYTKELGNNLEYNLISQYGYCYSKNYLLSLFIVKDENDNTQSHITTILDPQNYFNTAAYASLGSKYDVILRESNSKGKTSSITFHFTVLDKAPPLTEKKDDTEIKISYKEKLDTKFVEKYFYVSDNYDSELTYKILDSDLNAVKKNEIGKGVYVLRVSDSSGNTSDFKFIMERFDDAAPIIDCEYDEVTLNVNHIIRSQDLLSFFQVKDEIDGSLTPTVESNTYSENNRQVGEYEFRISAKDSSGNQSQKVLRLYVSDKDSPIFFAKENFFTFLEGNVPSETEIIQSLIRNDVIPDRNYVSMEYISGTEITNKLTEGNYESTVQILSDDGSTEIVDLNITITKEANNLISEVDSDTESAETTEQKNEVKETIWEKILRWLRELWEAFLDLICFWK